MDQKLYDLIDSYADAYADMLSRWVHVPSLKAAPIPGEKAPFGAELRRMLDLAMADARALGFDNVRDIDGYACDITYGEGDDPVAVLGHLDVVPVGDGWQVDPFGAVRDGDRIYGRGTGDDKGPVIASLFALKAIKDAGLKLKRPVRVILGCDEESDWEDMAYYKEHADMPKVGFSPDASFPLINTEKAMLHFALRGKLSPDGLQVKSLWTGERLNVIPGLCEAVVEGDQETVRAVEAFAAKTGLPYTAECTADGVKIVAEGIPGHSAYPEGRRNAIGMMLILLRELGVRGDLKTLADGYPMEHDGKSLGCQCADELSGPLTCNMGILHIENGGFYATLDDRCPVKADLDALEAATRAHLPGIEVETIERKVAHHVPAESELVTALLGAYYEETGLPAIPESTGGGTYAKVLEQGVAFGANFPDDPDLAHQAGEYIQVSKMIKAMKIYANALVRLCAE